MKKIKLLELLTPEGEALSEKEIPHNEYPRPRMVRDSFLCLNGYWDFGEGERIRVPFPPESPLSGIGRQIAVGEELIYKRSFSLPSFFRSEKDRLILHIGAADQYATVFLNGKELGSHEGGYSHFSFDITEHVYAQNCLEIRVRDFHNKGVLPYGKQVTKRGGMWYTPVSGIWQTVWLECVPRVYIKEIYTDCNTERAVIKVEMSEGMAEGSICFEGREIPLKNDEAVLVPEEIELWSPDTPRLYYFEVKVGEDSVRSYFALREIEIKEIDGIKRICLNSESIFLHAVLDQGYFSDGIYTPAALSAYERDILAMKKLGFNTLRKHIKVEPQRFYYDCDRLGMIVMQDMVNNGSYSFIRDTALPTVGMKKLPDKLLHRSKKTREAFRISAIETVKELVNHPSVLYFTIFNEGWGQFCGDEMYDLIKPMAKGCIVDTASGWFKSKNTDVISPHVYFKPVRIKRGDKPIVLSEFGGYSYSPEGHTVNPGHVYGYKRFESAKELMQGIKELYENEIIPAVKEGLCGAVLTQLSDVEDETNGLITYDRRLEKTDKDQMKEIAKKLSEAVTKKTKA